MCGVGGARGGGGGTVTVLGVGCTGSGWLTGGGGGMSWSLRHVTMKAAQESQKSCLSSQIVMATAAATRGKRIRDKRDRMKEAAAAMGLFLTFLLVNLLTTQLLGYPYPYCAARYLLMPLFVPWWHLALPFALVIFMWTLFRGWRDAVGGFVVLMLVGSAPEVFDGLLNIGGGCG